jgi:sporulation protein YqfD
LESAERFGISFGASRRYVRSERVKNALLADIESLQWVGVNTYGCVAVISVKERTVHDDAESSPGVRSIFANRDGIITDICVTKGKQICQVSQAVRSGQILVSGYTDCGFSVKAENAEAEIMAITNRQLSAVTLTTGQLRRTNLKNITRYSIQIGKNIVKLQGNSGIYDAGCVKIYNKKNLTLPGGFALPISLIQEKFYYYDNKESEDMNENSIRWVDIAADRYLQSDMLAGKILEKTIKGDFSNGCYNYYGVYICKEMIGQLQLEDRGEHNGERCN